MTTNKILDVPVLTCNDLSLYLDPESGWSFKGLSFKEADFINYDKKVFPVFALLADNGKRFSQFPYEHKWQSDLKVDSDKASVTYTHPEIGICITYELKETCLQITTEILYEKSFKLISLCDKKGILNFQDKYQENTYLISPRGYGGELVPFSGKNGARFRKVSHNGWGGEFAYGGGFANFIGAVSQKTGIILRPSHHAADFIYGEKPLNKHQCLYLSMGQHFRPRYTKDFRTSLCHKSLSFEIYFIDDQNNDGKVDWVDVGIAYRNKYIKPNIHRIKELKDGIYDTIEFRYFSEYFRPEMSGAEIKQVDEWFDKSAPIYQQLLGKRVKALYFAPSILRIVGAHVPVEECYDQKWYLGPCLDHGNFFKFKKEAAKYGTIVEVHCNLDDVYEDDADWDEKNLRIAPNGEVLKGGIWGGRQSYIRDIACQEQNGSIYKYIDHLTDIWKLQPGDSWIWDVFTTAPCRESYNKEHPATGGKDYDARMNILRYITEGKGIHLQSEGFAEGVSEYCGMGVTQVLNRNEKWFRPAFRHVRSIPLIHVIFSGSAYYSTWSDNPARNLFEMSLLLGCKIMQKTHAMDLAEIKEIYFKQNLFWSEISQLQVSNVQHAGNEWNIKYTNGVELKIKGIFLDKPARPCQKKNVSCMLKNGQICYDKFSPKNIWGYLGIWKEGIFEAKLPRGNYEVAEGNCQINRQVVKNDYTLIAGYNKGLSILKDRSSTIYGQGFPCVP